MAAPTRNSRTGALGLPKAGNPRAKASVAVGLLAALAVPAGIVLSYFSDWVTLVQSGASAGVGILLGLYAVVLARRGREQVQRTLGRSGGEGAARAGEILGVVGVCVGITAALALGFYGLLTLFD